MVIHAHDLLQAYKNYSHLKMLNIINGTSTISLRIVDWFVTNYAKKYYTVYTLENITKGPRAVTRLE